MASPVIVRCKLLFDVIFDDVNNNAGDLMESRVGCDLVIVPFSLFLVLVLVCFFPFCLYFCSCPVDHAANNIDSADHAKEGRDDCGLDEVFTRREGFLRGESSSSR